MKTQEKRAVAGIIFNDDRTEILMIQRRDIPVWVLPGGGVDVEESPQTAICREMLEETGYSIEIVRQIAEYEPYNRLTQRTYFFECRILDGRALTGDETQNIRFFPLKALPKLLPPPYPYWIADACANHPLLIKKRVEGVSYWVLVKLLLMHPILVGRYLLTKIGVHIND